MKLTKLLSALILILAISLLGCQKEPSANFTASKISAIANEAILFTNSTTNGDHYKWEFGDGTTSEEKNPSHSYATIGDYMVSLTAYSKNGKKSNSISQKISIGLSPVCVYSFTPQFPKPNETVQFTDNSTNSPTGWLWDFGDGSTSTDKNPSHTFATEKTYNISLKVTNDFGYATQSNNIVVNNITPVLPVANFTYTNQANNLISFQDQSTGNPTSWLWTFGDGATSTTQNPSHQYSQAGTYTVTLKVTNNAGYNQKSQTVNVANFIYSFLAGSYSVVDVCNGYTTNYTENITASITDPNKFYCNKFGNYNNALVYFIVSGTTINIPSQTVLCGISPTLDHTFSGSGNYSHNGSNVTINITYSDVSSIGAFNGCTGTYTKMKGKVKIDNTKDKTWYLLQQLKK